MAGRPPQHSSLRRALGALYDWAIGKQAVGKDPAGNVYYRWFEGSGPGRVERREVQWATAYMYYDPNDIPPEWRMWLRKQRDDFPTEAELQQSAAKQAALKARVTALEEAERLRRLRQQTVGTPDQHAGAQPDMARFLQQMTRGSGGPAGSSHPPGAPSSPAAPGGSVPGGGGSEQAPGPSAAFQAETWKP